MSALLTQSPGDIQTGTGKVDPARKFKCTTAARVLTNAHIKRQMGNVHQTRLYADSISRRVTNLILQP